jgi:hypothetical protein
VWVRLLYIAKYGCQRRSNALAFGGVLARLAACLNTKRNNDAGDQARSLSPRQEVRDRCLDPGLPKCEDDD